MRSAVSSQGSVSLMPLRRLASFQCLSPADRRALGAAAEWIDLDAGHLLVRRGDSAATVYVLLEGTLDVLAADGVAVVARLDAPAIVGEITLFAGSKRTASVTAATPSTLLSSAGEQLLAIGQRNPLLLQELADAARERLRRIQLRTAVERLAGKVDRELGEAIENIVSWHSLPAGSTLFERGAAADALFLVISGRLGVVRPGSSDQFIAEIHGGEPVGEMALLSDATRSTTVRALRDVDLARISTQDFQGLAERYPRLLWQVSRKVVERLRQQTEASFAPRLASTFAIISPHGAALAGRVAEGLQQALEEIGTVARVDAAYLDRTLGHAGIANTSEHDPAAVLINQWCSELETRVRFVIYVADGELTPWTRRAVRQSDHVLTALDADVQPAAPGTLETGLALYSETVPTTIALCGSRVNPMQRSVKSGHWLATRPDVCRHYWVDVADRADLGRLARSLIGEAVALVLGGGGARGFAHLGVLRALEEVGVPVDFVAGTSIGSIIAGGVAMGFDAQQCIVNSRRYFAHLFDPTLPVLSLLAGKRIGAQIDAAFGDMQIEDLALPYFCLASNLTRAEPVVYTRGRIAHAIRASIALPGILPPVSEDGDVLVDGGLLNNLPIDVMSTFSGEAQIIASDVSPAIETLQIGELASGASGWRMLFQRMGSSTPGSANILNVLMRASVVASIADQRRRRVDASLYLDLPVSEFRALDFGNLDAIAERGYSASLGPIRDWVTARRERQASNPTLLTPEVR